MGARNSKRPVWYDEFHACERVIDQNEIAKCDRRVHWQQVIVMSSGQKVTGHALEQLQLAHRFLFKRVLQDLSNLKRPSNGILGYIETDIQRKQRLQVLMNAEKLSSTCMEELLNDFGVSVWIWKASKIKTA